MVCVIYNLTKAFRIGNRILTELVLYIHIGLLCDYNRSQVLVSDVAYEISPYWRSGTSTFFYYSDPPQTPGR